MPCSQAARLLACHCGGRSLSSFSGRAPRHGALSPAACTRRRAQPPAHQASACWDDSNHKFAQNAACTCQQAYTDGTRDAVFTQLHCQLTTSPNFSFRSSKRLAEDVNDGSLRGLLASHGVVAYLCGHLHGLFGQRQHLLHLGVGAVGHLADVYTSTVCNILLLARLAGAAQAPAAPGHGAVARPANITALNFIIPCCSFTTQTISKHAPLVSCTIVITRPARKLSPD